MAIAQLTDLTYWYPNRAAPALSGVTVAIEEGLTVMSGPSGGGKSTLLRVLNGLVPHFHGGRIAGSAVVAGHDVIRTPTRRLARIVGFVFQDPELQTVYDSVEREVAFGLENVALTPREMPARIEEALSSAGIEHLAGRRVTTLSGGERQRVAIASAIAMRPQVIAFDEPTSQLDPAGAEMVLAAALGLAHAGRAVVIAEHRIERVMPSARSALYIAEARVQVVRPEDWMPPAAAPRPVRKGAVGAEAWSLSGVSAGFADRTVLERVDAAGRAGEVVVLSGPNGGGKTTLLRVIAGGLAPQSGRVERRPGRIAYLPQNPTALLHRPTLMDEVRLTLERARDPEPPQVILQALGLLPVADRYPRDLSCGERQRAALAAVLAGTPSLVLLDEPTRGMDARARDALIQLVAKLRDAGSAIVLATHDADLVGALADTILCVSDGAVREQVPLEVGR
ncbi:MAG: ABC transporter ATP-binding protein [Candidatus Dormibacterales bacterium]